MIITLAGEGGAGKTTVAKLLAEKLGYEHISAGGIRREVAKKHGMTIDEFNELGTREEWTDKEVDDYLVALGATRDNIVADSWMAWHFIPNGFKVYLTVDPNVAAQRVFENQRPTETKHNTVAEVKAMLQARQNGNGKRWLQWYNKDFSDTSQYDLVIDTTQMTPQEVVQTILAALPK